MLEYIAEYFLYQLDEDSTEEIEISRETRWFSAYDDASAKDKAAKWDPSIKANKR